MIGAYNISMARGVIVHNDANNDQRAIVKPSSLGRLAKRLLALNLSLSPISRMIIH